MEIPTNRMYGEFAYLWPLISAPEDYAEEAKHWRDALRDKLGPGRHHILELGVGGGNNLSHLTAYFDATAVDLSEGMLAHSRRLNPGVEHHVGDMRSVRLGRTFSAVIIHDAIDYLLTEDDIRATLATARAHLEPGGVFITVPDWLKETFHGPVLRDHGITSDGVVELTHLEYDCDPDPDDTTMEMIMFYIIREGGRLRIEPDRHVTGLFSRERWIALMEKAGFSTETRDYPVGDDPRQGCLLVGVLRANACRP